MVTAILPKAEKTIELEVREKAANVEALKTRLLELIEDFRWKNTRLHELEEHFFGFHLRVSYGVAQYGIEMIMPKGSAGKSRAELEAMDANEERTYKKMLRYRAEIDLLDYIGGNIRFPADRLNEMFDKMIEGTTKMSELACFFEVDRKTIYNMRDRILNVAVQDERVVKYLTEGLNEKIKYAE